MGYGQQAMESKWMGVKTLTPDKVMNSGFKCSDLGQFLEPNPIETNSNI